MRGEGEEGERERKRRKKKGRENILLGSGVGLNNKKILWEIP